MPSLQSPMPPSLPATLSSRSPWLSHLYSGFDDRDPFVGQCPYPPADVHGEIEDAIIEEPAARVNRVGGAIADAEQPLVGAHEHVAFAVAGQGARRQVERAHLGKRPQLA